MVFILKYYYKKQDFFLLVESISEIVMVETCQYRLVWFNGRPRRSSVCIFLFNIFIFLLPAFSEILITWDE